MNIEQNDLNKKTPTSIYVKMHIGHLGKIFFVYAILVSIFVVFCSLSTIIGAFAIGCYYIALVAATFFSIGIVLLSEDFRNLWGASLDGYNNFVQVISQILPYIIPIGLAFNVLTLILLIIDRHNLPIVRIVFTVISIIVLAISLIIQSRIVGV